MILLWRGLPNPPSGVLEGLSTRATSFADAVCAGPCLCRASAELPGGALALLQLARVKPSSFAAVGSSPLRVALQISHVAPQLLTGFD